MSNCKVASKTLDELCVELGASKTQARAHLPSTHGSCQVLLPRNFRLRTASCIHRILSASDGSIILGAVEDVGRSQEAEWPAEVAQICEYLSVWRLHPWRASVGIRLSSLIRCARKWRVLAFVSTRARPRPFRQGPQPSRIGLSCRSACPAVEKVKLLAGSTDAMTRTSNTRGRVLLVQRY